MFPKVGKIWANWNIVESCKYWSIHTEEFYPSRKVHSKLRNTMQKCKTQDKTVKHNERNTMSCKYWSIHTEGSFIQVERCIQNRKKHNSKRQKCETKCKSVKHNSKQQNTIQTCKTQYKTAKHNAKL